MPRRVGLSRIALGCVIAATALGAAAQDEPLPGKRLHPPIEKREAQPPAEAAKEEQDPSRRNQGTLPQAVPETKFGVRQSVDTDHEDRKATDPDSRTNQKLYNIARRDLAAQDSMADSTLHIKIAGWLQIILSLIGVALLGWTLWYTRGAVIEARRGTQAAFEAINVTRDVGVRQLRAYINVTEMHVEDFLVPKVPVLKLRVANTGHTPGYITKMHISFGLALPQKARRITFSNPDDDFRSRGSVGTSQVIVIQQRFGRTLTADDMRNIESGEKVAIVAMRIVYSDVFRVHRRTLLKAQLMPESLSKGVGALKPHHKGNRSS